MSKKQAAKAKAARGIRNLPAKSLNAKQAGGVKGGKLHEAACKGTHLPEVVIEVW
jgi:hypothetical protein